jgi:hypothetical protein
MDIAKELKTVKVAFQVHYPDIQTNPVIVRYGGKSGAVHELVITDHSWNVIAISDTEEYVYRVLEDYLSENPDRIDADNQDFVLSLDISHTWVPKEWGVNDDPRELGVAVLLNDPHFLPKRLRKTYSIPNTS